MLKTKDLMTREVHCCRPDDRLDQPIARMYEGDFGCMPVVSHSGAILGVVTDRDLCMAEQTVGRSAAELHVDDVMTHAVITCRPTDPASRVLERMGDYQVRRMPVVNQQRVVGIITLNDLARSAFEGSGDNRLDLEGVGLTLGAISRHRRPPAVSPARQLREPFSRYR